MTQRVAVVGDVHGCLEELQALLERLALTDKDRLVFAGDLVDKGPDSAGVVRYVRDLSTRMQVDVAMGNHEEIHIRWAAKSPEEKLKMKRHVECTEIHKDMTDADREFLARTKLYIKIPGGLVIHAGIPEYLRVLPELTDTYAQLPKRTVDLAKQMCRLRYVDRDGKFVGLYQTDFAVHTFWAERYQGQFGTVLFGHQPYMQDKPQYFKHAAGIDLGCVFGGYLCAVELGDPDHPDGILATSKIHLEEARKQYAPLYGGE